MPGSGLKGCTVTQQVPWAMPLFGILHSADFGTLLCTFTTWYCVGP